MSTELRVVHCTYTPEPVPMGRARTRCPSCGAVVQEEIPKSAHYVERIPLYLLVVPETRRSGPGHKSHLSPDGGKTTLCRVENNARGLVPYRTDEPVPLEEIAKLELYARTLCANCRDLVERRDS